MIKLRLLPPLALALAVLLSGCGGGPASLPSTFTPAVSEPGGSAPGSTSTAPGAVDTPTPADPSALFSDRDFRDSYDSRKSALIQLSGDSASCSSNAVQISGTTVTITDEGTYVLSGTLNDGMIIVNTEKSDKTQLVLDGVTIHSQTCAPICILQADKVFLTLAEGSVNTLSNAGTYTPIDENNIDSVIFSKEDLTLNGSGSLTITSPAGHGIVSKDELTLTGGSYTINCSSHALTGKDGISIADTTFDITSGKDGIHAENADDSTLGHVYIRGGTFRITSEGDGISAGTWLQIDDGTFEIVSGGGSANAATQTSQFRSGFMGGGHGPGGKMPGGGMGGKMPGVPGSGWGDMPAGGGTTVSEEDSTSIKAIKAAGDLVINGGTFTIDSADDSVHSNSSVTVSAGVFDIASGDDAFHADDTLTVTGGTIRITKSYEGLEGLHIVVSGGDIALVADDDGLNAAGGTDASGMAGPRAPDQFRGGIGGMGGSSNGSILISGGNLYVKASGDGIDANGTLTISGGVTVVCGPTQGDTATLDYDSGAVITGGTFIGTGASGMAQTFSDSEQGVISVSVGSRSAGTRVTLTDAQGKQLLSFTPELNFAVVILSSPDMVKGQSYTISVGSASGTFSAS